jgi:predicted transcriptional regulator of viral defense system
LVMRSIDFFENHPLFTHEEFVEARAPLGRSRRTTDNLLARHLAAGRLVRVRRGLYATVPRGVRAAQVPVDPYLVATKLRPDAALAYHAALQFHGRAYSIWRRFHYLTRGRARPFSFRELEFVPVRSRMNETEYRRNAGFRRHQ